MNLAIPIWMAPLKKLDKLIISEILSLTLVIMAAVSSIMFLFRLLAYADVLLVSQDGITSLAMFLVFILPGVFKITLPVSLLLATTITIFRMAQDRELEAWMASGMSLWRLLRAPFLLGFAFTLVSLGSTLFFEPYARLQYKKFEWMSTRKMLEAVLESRLVEKTFVSNLVQGSSNNIALYMDEYDKGDRDFRQLFLAMRDSNSSYSTVIVAEKGRFAQEERNGFSDFILKLENGHFYQPQDAKTPLGMSLGAEQVVEVEAQEAEVSTEKSSGPFPVPPDWKIVGFKTFDISLLNLFEKQFAVEPLHITDYRSLYPVQFIERMREERDGERWRNKDKTLGRQHAYFYEQIVVPLSCLLLPLIGVCLGIQDPRRKAGMVYLGTSLVIFSYYAAIMVCQQLATLHLVPPYFSLVAPLTALIACALLLLKWRYDAPPSVGFSEYIGLQSVLLKLRQSVQTFWGRGAAK